MTPKFVRRSAFAATLALLLAAVLGGAVRAETPPQPPRLQNGLALTPPMGWNSWNRFGCNIDERLIRTAADQLAGSGMAAAGYRYVVIDDCWHGERDAAGNIQADPQRFPSGIKALADYVHGKGLKFGIYSDVGSKTCAGRPGSQGHEYQDAAQYAAWGVDYLKYDWCNTGTADARAAYTLMSDALRASGRPIVFSLCEWGTARPWLWAKGVGNLWRTTGDIYAGWQGKRDYALGVLDILDLQDGLDGYAGPGHWNDPDMLEVGNPGLSIDEQRAHFSLWAILAAPLIAGNDLAAMTPETQAILTNREVIAVDQDAKGMEGRRVSRDGDGEVWARPLADGSRAVVLLNRGVATRTVKVDWVDLGYPAHLKATVRDLWAGRDLKPASGAWSAQVQPHSAVMVRITP